MAKLANACGSGLIISSRNLTIYTTIAKATHGSLNISTKVQLDGICLYHIVEG